MNEALILLIAACGLAIVVVGLLVFGAYYLFRRVGLNPFGLLGGLNQIWNNGDEGESVSYSAQTQQRPSYRRRLHDQVDSLDFDAAVERHRQQDPDVHHSNPQMPDTPGLNASRFDVDSTSPINGRIMRDGRYRRVTGGTPGREQDQDFRRVEGSNFELDLPPDTTSNRGKFGSNGSLRRKRRDRNEDELFGGMLDEDGDGDLDF